MYKDKCGTGYENSTRAIFQGAGEYDIPIIEPTKITENNFIGFNEVLSSKQNNYSLKQLSPTAESPKNVWETSSTSNRFRKNSGGQNNGRKRLFKRYK